MKKWGLYEWTIILLFIVLPSVAISMENLLPGSTLPLAEITFKWVVFCAIGLRLGAAGIKQISQPQFTAQQIFKIQSDDAFSIVRELGFANVCFSVIALISLFVPTFRIPAAVAGGLYYGLAGLLHVMKPKDSSKEIFAMVSDLFIFLMLGILIAISLV